MSAMIDLEMGPLHARRLDVAAAGEGMVGVGSFFASLLFLLLLPETTMATIYACSPPDAYLTEYRRAPCDPGDDSTRIDTVTVEHAEPPHDVVLARADRYYRHHVLGGEPVDLDAWLSEDALGSTWYRDQLPAAFESSRSYAEKHGGVASIEFEVKGALDDLVAANVYVEFGDGRIDKQSSCWKRERDEWRFHTSCLEIAMQQEDLTDEDEEALEAIRSLMDDSEDDPDGEP